MKKIDKILDAMRIDSERKVKLGKIATDSCEGVADKKDARLLLDELTADMSELQFKLYAEAKTGLLIVIQAMDTGGKDGAIRKVFGPMNPQGVQVASFKQPTPLELSHDYLWRVHPFVPAKGMIRVFNRSHYEDVLIHRVRKLEPDKALEKRYRQINDFERYLAENSVVILKFFLHISKDEQKRRLESRLADATRRWKFSTGDLEERKLWDQYQEAYEIMLSRCSREHAPWYVIPADNKWYRDWAMASVIRRTLKKINPKFPKEQEGLDGLKVE